MHTVNREIMKSEKKARPTQPGEPVLVRLQPDDLALLDEWRTRHGAIGRPEALRRLIRALALDAEAKKRGRK